VKFEHDDPAMITRVVDAYTGQGLMQEFHPCPVELEDERSTTYGGSNKDEQDALRASNTERFGYANWYDWRVANWGTKWDVTARDNGDPAVTDDGLGVQFSFCSAWAPPLEFYNKMQELGFRVDAFYYESGMAFCGRYNDGSDDYYEIKGNSDWVDENIPDEINIQFAISESMSEWEQEEAELVQDEE
jgi:hypothetical protein